MSQNSKIRTHLKAKGFITSWDAIHFYHITRLAARISDLREQGMNIKTVLVPNRNGKGTHAKYTYDGNTIRP